MPHYIEEAIYKFVSSPKKLDDDKASLITGNNNIKDSLLKELSSEFADRIKESTIRRYSKDKDESSFSIRMSNIGLPIRQLCLQRDNGRVSNQSFAISGFYGDMLEHFTLFLLKASGINVQETNKKTILDVNGYKIPGELDLIIDGSVWDVKSASDYSYDIKFESYKSLEDNDSFGYLAQLFGYAMAENVPVGGWIVINKAKGLIKVVPVPISIQKAYKLKYMQEFDDKIKHITTGKAPPPCTGVIKEQFYKKDTGNLILNRDCFYCNYKQHCHEKCTPLDDVNSIAQKKTLKYYIGDIKYRNANA